MKREFQTAICLQLFVLSLAVPVLAGHDTDGWGESTAKVIGSSLPLPANPSRLSVLGSGMGFPFRNGRVVREIRAYGISPWGGEPVHNGIDIIVDNTGAVQDVGDLVPVISPVQGTVRGVLHLENPHNPATPQWILVVIAVNPGLFATLSFEPQTEDVDLQALQAMSIDVVAGQRVRKGQVIGALVVGEGGGMSSGSGNPHIDLRLLLMDPATLDPGAPLEDLLALDISHNDVAMLPTFLCPFDYSSIRAKHLYERVLRGADPTTQCGCPCVFPYNEAACGPGCVD